MAATNALLSVNDFARLPPPLGGVSQELHRGKLIELPPAKKIHTKLQKRLVNLLEGGLNVAEYVVDNEFPFALLRNTKFGLPTWLSSASPFGNRRRMMITFAVYLQSSLKFFHRRTVLPRCSTARRSSCARWPGVLARRSAAGDGQGNSRRRSLEHSRCCERDRVRRAGRIGRRTRHLRQLSRQMSWKSVRLAQCSEG